MVSRTIASVGQWIAEATEVLSEVGPKLLVESGPPTDPSAGPEGAVDPVSRSAPGDR